MVEDLVAENLLQQQEGIRLEFRQKIDKNAIARTIVAFLNTRGGDVLVGIGPNKEIIGIQNVKLEVDAIKKILIEDIKPSAPVSIQTLRYNNKDLILISAWEGAKKPYHYKGKICVRENDTTRYSTIDELNLLIGDRKSSDFSWERMAVLGAEMDDLDSSQINETVTYYNSYRPNSYIESVEDFLIQMGLIQNGNITNACVLLFAKNPRKFLPQATVRLTVYPSDMSGNEFLNDRVFEGNIFSNIKDIYNLIDATFGKVIRIEGVLREERLNYPLLAIREGLINAIVHRDYSSVNGFLQISIFSNRTEISNFGGLPDGVNIPDLKKEHSSVLRNPDVAQICFLRKHIEMLGSGTLRMISDCKKNGFKAPVWTDKQNITTVVFPGLGYTRKFDDGVNDGVRDGVKKVSFVDESDGVNSELNALYETIRKMPGLNARTLARQIDKSIPTTERYIKKLRVNNYIQFVGAPKTGGYFPKE